MHWNGHRNLQFFWFNSPTCMLNSELTLTAGYSVYAASNFQILFPTDKLLDLEQQDSCVLHVHCSVSDLCDWSPILVLTPLSLLLSDWLWAGVRETHSMPNWALTSSDFFGWVEELRSHAGYDKIQDLARTFWAHFPSASRLGYDPPAPEE